MRNLGKVYNSLFTAAVHISPLVLRKYSFHTDHLPEINEPFLMLANHTTELDFLMASCAAGVPMRFVLGEHLLRGHLGSLLQRIANPIAVPKGASSVPAVKEILHRLRQGDNILLFPEGSRSFHGETVPQNSSLGKLVKLSGAALVTYRIQGGYFVAPRWASYTRVGPMEGHVVHVYSSEKLGSMTASEIADNINSDLHENAYDTQQLRAHRYKGKALAEGLENYLIICPHCGGYDSLVSEGDRFHCKLCGLQGVYDEYGFLQGRDLDYHSVYDWGKWIEKRFDTDVSRRNADELLFTENDIRLYRIDAVVHNIQSYKTASLKIFRNRFEIGDYSLTRKTISEMAMLYYGKSLLLKSKEGYVGMTGPTVHGWKTDRLYRLEKAGS